MPHRDVEQRKRAARISLVAWYAQVPVLAALLVWGTDFVLLAYLGLISVWTGVESAHARLNADLPSEEGQ